MKHRNILLTIKSIPIVIYFLFALFSAATAAENGSHVRTKVEVLEIAPRTLNSYSTYVGHLEPNTKVSISSEIAGVIEDLAVNQGTQVKKNDTLIQIDTKRQLLNKQLNESNYELALNDYERENKLLEKNLTTPAKVSALKNNLDVNRLRLELAALDVEKSRISAPISGVISQQHIEIGEYVRVGSELLEILDLSKVLGIINVPERDIRFIQLHKEVTLNVDALPDESFIGNVKKIGLEADMQSRTFKVEVLINNPDAKLFPGMLIRARLLKVKLINQVIIPRYTIQEEEQGSFVYVIKNNKIVKRIIKVGISVDGEIQVLSGLNFKERLVQTGQQLVSPDELVDVIATKQQK
jgi:membrane fusion protein (multidrug efflux system)